MTGDGGRFQITRRQRLAVTCLRSCPRIWRPDYARSGGKSMEIGQIGSEQSVPSAQAGLAAVPKHIVVSLWLTVPSPFFLSSPEAEPQDMGGSGLLLPCKKNFIDTSFIILRCTSSPETVPCYYLPSVANDRLSVFRSDEIKVIT